MQLGCTISPEVLARTLAESGCSGVLFFLFRGFNGGSIVRT